MQLHLICVISTFKKTFNLLYKTYLDNNTRVILFYYRLQMGNCLISFDPKFLFFYQILFNLMNVLKIRRII